MNIGNRHFTALWYEAPTDRVLYIDQTCLPRELVIREMKTFEDGVRAIRDMEVRGAPLIGAAAAFAMYRGLRPSVLDGPPPGNHGLPADGHGPPPDPLLPKEGEHSMVEMAGRLIATRPTAVNLAKAVNQMLQVTDNPQPDTGSNSRITRHASRLLEMALNIRQTEINHCRRIGEHGLQLIREISDQKGGQPVNILTHCNAGWLAAIDFGTALSPVYKAHDSGVPVHVWVDETRPRNQGAKLTVYELSQHGVPNTLIVDNAGGLLMQQGKVDLVFVGADRITANGDVLNKIGTYLKALAAFDNQVPFYVAAPTSTFDRDTPTWRDVEIEDRGEMEILFLEGEARSIAPPGTRVHNPGFDNTPSRLINGYLTENGLSKTI